MEISPETKAFLDRPLNILIDGKWKKSASKKYFDVLNPATGDVIARASHANQLDTEAAIAAARASFDQKSWRRKTPSERAKIMWKIADLLEEHCQELAELETLNNGKPFDGTKKAEVPFAAECFRYYAGWCTKIEGQTKDISMVPDAQFHVYTRREPVGVVGLIVPWNGPLVQASWKLAPALAAACSIIIKPAEQTPLSTIRLGELIQQAGVPDGIVNIITGSGSEVGATLAAHPDVDKISFTGSTETGRHIIKSAGGNLKKVTLELGGKSPLIIFADADLKNAIRGAANAIFSNAGQVCVAGSRLYIEEPVYDEVINGVAEIARNLKVGAGTNPETEMGPLISEAHLNHVWSMIESGRNEGARLVTGGHRIQGKGFFIEPTLLADTTHEMRVVQEEIFGPVVCAMKFNGFTDIEPKANDTIYGLAASIWTRDINKAHRLAAEIKAGLVWINCHGLPDMAVSFGGYKQSGWGRENGYEGLLQYTELKSVIAYLDDEN